MCHFALIKFFQNRTKYFGGDRKEKGNNFDDGSCVMVIMRPFSLDYYS